MSINMYKNIAIFVAVFLDWGVKSEGEGMAVNRQRKNVAYGVNEPSVDVFPLPIVANRAPGVNDKAQVGTIWADTNADDTYILVSIKSNVANWISAGGGSGSFSSLTVTDDITSTNGDITSGGSISATTTVTANTNLVAVNNIDATNGDITANSGDVIANTDITAGGNISAGGNVSATGNLGGTLVVLGNTAEVLDGTGDPSGSVNAPQGSLYLRRDGSSTSTRAYINTDGATAWTNITTAA